MTVKTRRCPHTSIWRHLPFIDWMYDLRWGVSSSQPRKNRINPGRQCRGWIVNLKGTLRAEKVRPCFATWNGQFRHNRIKNDQQTHTTYEQPLSVYNFSISVSQTIALYSTLTLTVKFISLATKVGPKL